ncbi:alpha-L-rhamnosidase-related protein [Croceiramulus getboli]|nr:alpha-L-rhamnosidase C-terminal domain-containing protein [Flavobacteriaceae bacterium YJPT1-3]
MRNLLVYTLLVLLSFISCQTEVPTAKQNMSLNEPGWKAQWIAPQDQSDTINAWTVFRTDVELDAMVPDTVVAQIAVDSKYWLWINGQLVIREGGLKRGPTPNGTYFDEVAISSLKQGRNSIVILSNYFGKDGFSHKDSGQNAVLFNLVTEGFEIVSDSTWKAWPHPAFGETSAPYPNYRLPESNLLFDANKGDFSFRATNFETNPFSQAVEVGEASNSVFGTLIKRPIPLWKDFGLKEYQTAIPERATGDTLKLRMPYNAQVSPYLKIEAPGGDTIDIRTDHYRGGGPPNVRAQYVTRKGVQEFEVLGWMNGHEVHYYIPEGIKIIALNYRESGYDTEFSGQFSCDDDFYNLLGKKALRTLYITMRDTYMDCPDRERAQWWGDVVLESGESFYALDRKADALTRKGILELLQWQRQDSTIFSPVPAGNWDQELPGQMLASVGYYGIYNYYLHTGDLETIRSVYEPVKKYLALWKLKPEGTVEIRKGGWTWGDWGDNKDIPLLLNTQYHLAQKGLLKMAEALGNSAEADSIQKNMNAFKLAFNSEFWRGDHYRSAEYDGKTDDRSQALAVVSGLADPDKYEAIVHVLKNEFHASPYMEKYVVEALFQMGEADFALARLKKRFKTMVTHPSITTLWEGWGIGSEGYGGGTINHAWSGGGLTLLYQYVAGIEPINAEYRTFKIQPQLGPLTQVSATVESVQGRISVDISKTDRLEIKIRVPQNTSAELVIPEEYSRLSSSNGMKAEKLNQKQISVSLEAGIHTLIAQ